MLCPFHTISAMCIIVTAPEFNPWLLVYSPKHKTKIIYVGSSGHLRGTAYYVSDDVMEKSERWPSKMKNPFQIWQPLFQGQW